MLKDSIPHLRLIAQSIAEPYLTEPRDVVRSMGAVQAQDYGQALWAIGLRTKDAKLQDMLGAIESGQILRTWPMRGTIHFVPAEDAGWMVGLSGEKTLRAAKARHEGLGVTEKITAKAEELFRRDLAGGKRLPRPALMQLLEDNGISTVEQRGYHILWTLALRGVLCIGPMENKQQTYALLSEWVPRQRRLERDEALGELARRYFISHGPALLADFATWSGQSQRDAAIGLELAKPHLASMTIGGKEYWLDRTVRQASPASLRATYLLAGFEEYLLGYKHRDDILDKAHASFFYTNGVFFPIVVRDGRAVCGWRRTITPKNISIRLVPFEPISPELERDIHQRAKQYSEFMGLPVEFVDS